MPNLTFLFCRKTFEKVLDEACEHQSWYRSQIITEYYSHTSLPPPFSSLYFFIATCYAILKKVGATLGKMARCCCRSLKDASQNASFSEVKVDLAEHSGGAESVPNGLQLQDRRGQQGDSPLPGRCEGDLDSGDIYDDISPGDAAEAGTADKDQTEAGAGPYEGRCQCRCRCPLVRRPLQWGTAD